MAAHVALTLSIRSVLSLNLNVIHDQQSWYRTPLEISEFCAISVWVEINIWKWCTDEVMHNKYVS